MCFSDELIKTVAVIKKLNLGLCNSKTDKGEGKLAKQNRDYCKCKINSFLQVTPLLNGEDINVSVRKGRGNGGVARKSEAGIWRQNEAGDDTASTCVSILA